MDEDRRELATVFRLIRKERPDLARKLHKVLYGLAQDRRILNSLVVIAAPQIIERGTVH